MDTGTVPDRQIKGIALVLACVGAALLGRLYAGETAALANLSVRTTLAASQTLILGGVVDGGNKNILVRGSGPALNRFGLSGMADPRLALYTTGTNPVSANDDWPAALGSVFASTGAFSFDPGSKDAALTHTVGGNFSAQLSGNTAGTVMVEVYDMAGGLSPRLINLSARNLVGTGSDILIAGFYIAGTGMKKLLIRAVGPGLASFGVPGTLADPLLRVFDAKGSVVASNDNWDAALAATASSVGAFPLTPGSRDAALLLSLPAGATYSVQVSGVGGTTGEAIVEVYEVPDPVQEARLPMASSRRDVGLGFPRISNRLRSTGDVKFSVILVDFSDAPATRTPQSVLGLVSPGAENVFRTLSAGRLNVTFEPHLQWLRMSKPSTGYGWSSLTFAAHRAYIQEALNLAAAAGVNFSSSDAFLVLANPDATVLTNGPAFCATPGNGVTAGGKTFENGATSGRDLLSWGHLWFNHEIGHALGLPDLYPFSGLAHRFVGDFSLMGRINGTSPEIFAWERWNLGWIDDSQVLCPDRGTSIVTLSPLETVGDAKMVVLPTGATTAIVVESWRPLGLDRTLARPGPLAYYLDTSVPSGEGVIKLLPLLDTDSRRLDAPMTIGQTITHQGVSIRYVSGDANTVTLEIVRP